MNRKRNEEISETCEIQENDGEGNGTVIYQPHNKNTRKRNYRNGKGEHTQH